jgi:VIT1/CCC1 family predicted Fe2+/Mn2+ transporter
MTGVIMKSKKKIEGSIAFGIMDGIITLLGILLAMFAISADQKTILVAAIATAIADSTANAAGYHVSEEAADSKKHSEATRSSVLCFVATLIAMMIPLVPVFILSQQISIYVAIAICLTILFLLGQYVKGWKVGIEYLAIGVIAGIVCYAVGILVK